MPEIKWGENFPVPLVKTMLLLQAWVQFYIATQKLEIAIEINSVLEGALERTEIVFANEMDPELLVTLRTLADGLFQKTSGLDPAGVYKAWANVKP